MTLSPYGPSVIVFVTLCSGAVAAQPKPATPDSINWEGQSGGFTIRSTASGLTARGSGSEFALLPQVRLAFDKFAAEVKDEGPCTYERKFHVLSVVGPFLSLRDDLYSSCEHAAHPSGESRSTTLDLSHSGKAVSLTDLFPEKTVLKALLADPVIQSGISDEPRTLSALRKSIDSEGLTAGNNPCKFQLEPDYLTRFAFHHVENGQVAVRLSLSPIGGACRSSEAQLGLLLPVPASLKEPLELASSGKQGFLMKDAKKAVKGETLIHFQTKASR